MPRSMKRTYSRYTLEAIGLLAAMIQLERKNRKMTGAELAERAGISRSMLQRIEKADPKCELGVVFEIAALLGIPLFNSSTDGHTLSVHRRQAEERLSLLPLRVRKPNRETFDDF